MFHAAQSHRHSDCQPTISYRTSRWTLASTAGAWLFAAAIVFSPRAGHAVPEDDSSAPPIPTVNSLVFARGVEARAPRGEAQVFTADVGTVWAFASIAHDGPPSRVMMIWRHKGEVRAEIDVRIGRSKRWRTWSRKRIGPRDVGPWSVEIIDKLGQSIAAATFEIAAAEPPVAHTP